MVRWAKIKTKSEWYYHKTFNGLISVVILIIDCLHTIVAILVQLLGNIMGNLTRCHEIPLTEVLCLYLKLGLQLANTTGKIETRYSGNVNMSLPSRSHIWQGRRVLLTLHSVKNAFFMSMSTFRQFYLKVILLSITAQLKSKPKNPLAHR